MANGITTLTSSTFDETVSGSTAPVVVDFWAEWCGPCRAIAPTLEALAEEYDGKVKVAKLDVDHNQQTAMKFNVRSIPMIAFFKDGQHVDTVVGAMPRPAFEAKIKQHLA